MTLTQLAILIGCWPRLLLSAVLVSCIALSACSSSANNQTPLDDGNGSPGIPGNLYAAVYSSTEIELFWSPSSDDGWVMGYDIYRNDQLIQERLDANSYFDAQLEPGTSYHYTVIAVDDDDNYSIAAETDAVTQDAPSLPAINQTNHVALISHVFDIFVGDGYNKPLLSLEAMALDETNGTADLIEHEWHKTYDCDSEGSGSSTRRDGYLEESQMSMQFSSCTVAGTVYDGDMTGYGNTVDTSGFTIKHSESQEIRFIGNARRLRGSREPFGNTPSWLLDDVDFTHSTTAGDLIVSNANTRFSVGHHQEYTFNFQAYLEGDFSVQSPETGMHVIAVSTPETFTYECQSVPYDSQLSEIDWSFETGSLQLSADDGSALSFNADNGDADSVTITLTNAGQTVEFNEPWSQWQHQLQFDDVQQRDPFNTDVLTDTPVIRSDNYEQWLDTAFDVMTGTGFWDEMVSVPVRWEGNQSYDINLDQRWAYAEHTCLNDGNATTQHSINGWYYEYAYSEFNQCLFDENNNIVYDGTVRGFTNAGGYGLISDGLALQRTYDMDLSYSGWLRRSSSFSRLDHYNLRHTDSLNVQIHDSDDGQIDIRDASLFFGDGWLPGEYRADLAGRAIVIVSDRSSHRVEISTPVEFNYSADSDSYEEDWYYQVGSMRLRADDGSEVILSADTGVANTVEISLTNKNGTQKLSSDWTRWQSFIERNRNHY